MHFCIIFFSITCLAQRMTLPPGHPNVDDVLRRGTKAPASHPPIHQRLLVMGAFDDDFAPVNSFDGHPNVDQMIKAGRRLPGDHPRVSRYFVVTAASPNQPARTSTGKTLQIPGFHPDIGSSYAAGTGYPQSHPSMNARLASILPAGHPNVDAAMANPAANPLPPGHPPLNQYFVKPGQTGTQAPSPPPNSPPSTTVGGNVPSPAPQNIPSSPAPKTLAIPGFHPDIGTSYAAGKGYPPSHPPMNARLAAMLPPGHPDVDAAMANPAANPLPSSHPPLSQYFVKDTPKPSTIPSSQEQGAVDLPWPARSSALQNGFQVMLPLAIIVLKSISC
jgi:hypothetical protein